jgi:DNA-binding NtrC family response regulator
MGYVHAEIELTNHGDVEMNYRGLLPENEIRRVTTRALVDSGAWDLVINEEVQRRLNLRVLGKQTVRLADETLLEVEIVGPVEVRFEERSTDLKVIFISGYAEDAFRQHLAENEDFMFLQKPFDLKQLAAAVKAALEA